MKSESPSVIRQAQNSSSISKSKYTQKFCEKWMSIFSPWLTRCEDDPNKPFCRACQCRLDCNRCHLHRHERTSKHVRNLEILVNKGEGAARQNLSIRRERSKYYQQRRNVDVEDIKTDKMDDDTQFYLSPENENDNDNEEFIETNDQTTNQSIKCQYEEEDDDNINVKETTELENNIEVNESNMDDVEYNQKESSAIVKTEKMTATFKRLEEEKPEPKQSNNYVKLITKDTNDLLDSFKELVNGTITSEIPHKRKNHVDLFFESVSSSVKAFSPKLIAEAKMRVSQIICELELRSLTES